MKAALVALVILAACQADPPGDAIDASAGSDGADGPTADSFQCTTGLHL